MEMKWVNMKHGACHIIGVHGSILIPFPSFLLLPSHDKILWSNLGLVG